MRRAAVRIVVPGFLQTEGAVDGQAYIRGVFIFLAIVFPPANGAQSERVGHFERLITAARATKSGLNQSFHTNIDGKKSAQVYAKGAGSSGFRSLIPFLELLYSCSRSVSVHPRRRKIFPEQKRMTDRQNDLESVTSGVNPVGLRPQVGGGLAIFIGVLLFAFYPNVQAGAPINLHQMARLFIGIGVFLVVADTIARLFSVD
jgi:hypothetical protein